MAAAAYTPAGPGMPPAAGVPGGFGPPPAPPRRGPAPMVPHLIWEAVLVLATVVVLILLRVDDDRLVSQGVIGNAPAIGLLGAAMALSIWAGAPNLAVGSIALFTIQIGAWLVDSQGWSLWPAMAAAAILSIPIGLVMGALAGPLGLPGWAVTLTTAIGLEAIALAISDSRAIVLPFDRDLKWIWFVLFVVVAVATAGLTWVPGVRALVTPASASRDDRSRPPASGFPGLAPLLALLASSFLAAVAGVAQANRVQATFPQSGFSFTTTALAIALLGGASALGGRLGFVGTVLAAVVLSGLGTLLGFHGQDFWVNQLVLAVAALVGLVVGAALGRVGAADRSWEPEVRTSGS